MSSVRTVPSVRVEVPPAPPAAAVLCGDALERITQYAAVLADRGVLHGLIGPREVPRLWDRHLLNCAALSLAIPQGASVLDLGSGAGLPGLVLALVRPDLRVTLLEPLQRRVSFLDDVTAELGLGHVGVVRARAEDVIGEIEVDVVTSRAVAPLARLVQWSLPLTVPGGVLLAIKGRTAPEELAAAAKGLRAAGAANWAVEEWGGDVLDEPTTVIRVTRSRSKVKDRTKKHAARRHGRLIEPGNEGDL